MNLLNRLLGKREDPTLSWKPFSLPIPDFDVAQMRFGTLRFGDGFETASFLGRPEQVEWTDRAYCALLYASGGFQIDFDEGRFAYLAFLIGPDKYLPKYTPLEFSKPRLHGCTPDAIQLSNDTDRVLLKRLFGDPGSVDSDEEETILFYTRQNVTMEFELDGKMGHLKRWNLYPK